nr:PREDICTED: uncharacterized protein LOC102359386 isoform X2 [Latimeria chalumnae]|eukprot:XP_014353971.1 PREDICTED: uncharacterized protein LOC102359386 isoform X2 [Latimeria chalumnae]
MEESEPLRTKSELVLSHLQDGATTLLHKWPEMKGKLYVFFNQPLLPGLRKLAWRLFLSNTKARMEYLRRVSVNKAKSVWDLEISQRCQSLLSTEATFQHLKDNNTAVTVMRNVLSYCHKIQRMKDELPETDFLLLLPLLQVAIATATRSASIDALSALLVEEYITLMELRPQFMRLPGAQNSAGLHVFEEVAVLLEEKDKEVASVIQKIYSQQGDQPHDSLLRGTQSILQPVIRALFVGYLNVNTLLYVWDQFIIGLEEPSYDCIPAFSFALIVTLGAHLKACEMPGEVDAVLSSQSPSLSVQQFQSVISKYFYRNLYKKLNREEADAFPILDPTQTFPPLWTHLSRGELPARTRPKDRRLAREEREALRLQTMEKQKQDERLRKLREEEQVRREENRLQKLLEEVKENYSKQKSDLEEQLAEERQLRHEMQKAAEEQIGQLQAEMKRIMEHKRPSFDTCSQGSFTVPPPSLNSQASSRIDQPAPSAGRRAPPTASTSVPGTGFRPKEVNGRTAKSVTLDLLRHLMQTADSIANGYSVGERDTLNTLTREHIFNFKQDVRNAELEIFGRQLGIGETEQMPEPRRSEMERKLNAAVRRGVEARYKAHITTGKQLVPNSVSYMGT